MMDSWPAAFETFRTKAAPAAIAAIRREVPEATVGAGTLLSPEAVAACDVDGNGTADAADALIIMRYALGLIDTL